MSPHKFSMGLRSRGLGWPLHNFNFAGLEPRCCLLIGVFGVIVLMKHPFQGHFIISIMQLDRFKYFDISKLIHDPWYAKNRPSTIVGETSHIMILAPPCFTVFSVYCGLNSVFGGCLTNRLWPLDPRITVLLYQSTKCFVISL